MIKGISLTALLAASFSLQAQVVSLFAGSQYVGDGAYSGATGAYNKLLDSFSIPMGIAADTSNRFWLTEQHNVFMLSGSNTYPKGGNTGNPNTPGGSGYSDKTGTQSLFANPAGCTIHPKSNRIYVCDLDNNVIRFGTSSVINATDQIVWSTFAGDASFLGGYNDGSVDLAEFNGPHDVAITTTGIVYIADAYNHCIRKISGGTVSTIAGLGETSGDATGTGATARFAVPIGLSLIDDNTLLVADRNNGKIKQIDLTNNSVTTVVSGLNAPTDMVKVNGNIYIADSYCIRVWNGSTLKEYAGKVNVGGYVNASDVTARFRNLTNLIYHPKTESMYVTDMGNNVFRQVTVSQPPVANFSADKTSVTVGQVVTLTSTSSNAASLLWNITPTNYSLLNGTTLTSTVVMLSFDQTGSYNVELTATNPTGSNKKTSNNYINVSLIGANKPTVDFYADKVTAAIGETVSFIDQTGDNPISFAWEFTPNTVTYVNSTTSTTRFPKVTFNNAGKYTVKLTATNTNGSNFKTRTDYITIAGVSVADLETRSLNLYPNPANASIHIGNGFSNVKIFDMAGKVIVVALTQGILNISELKSGMYSIQAVDNSGVLFTGRFVKTLN